MIYFYFLRKEKINFFFFLKFRGNKLLDLEDRQKVIAGYKYECKFHKDYPPNSKDACDGSFENLQKLRAHKCPIRDQDKPAGCYYWFTINKSEKPLLSNLTFISNKS